MKLIMIAVFSILIMPAAVAAQTVFCLWELETCPDNFPPDAEVVVGGRPVFFYKVDTFERDALWYFYDDTSRTWSTIDDSEFLSFADGAFDDGFDQLGWEAYLQDADTAVKVRSDGNTIDVMDEYELHLIDLSSAFVLSVPYREFGTSCTAPDGGRLDWYEDERAWRELSQEGGTRIVRCKYGFSFSREFARLRSINDPELIKTGVLKVLDSSSPFYQEKTRFSIEHQLNSPGIWFYHSSVYGARFGLYLRLDGTYEDDLETGTLGLRQFGYMELHDRIVRWDIAGQQIHSDYGGIKRKRHARSALVELLERVLTVTPAKWLLWVETGDDNILIRNLSTMYREEEKQ